MNTMAIGDDDALTRHLIFFAVPDPSNPDRLTFWRRDRRGRLDSYLSPWPMRKQYGPVLPASEEGNPLNWAIEVCWPWHRAVRETLRSDLNGCSIRFTVATGRCCVCAKPTDTDGICGKCQVNVPAELTHRIANAIAEQEVH